MRKTNHYNMNLPDAEDFYDVEEFNSNVETIDSKLHEVEEMAMANIADVEEAKRLANEAKSVAAGKNKGYLFENKTNMLLYLKTESNKGTLRVGDLLLIRQKDVPDYWITSVFDIPDAGGYYFGFQEVEADTAGMKSDIAKKVDKTSVLTSVDACIKSQNPSDVVAASVVAEMNASFQAGVDGCYEAAKAKGQTPASHYPSDVIAAIGRIQTNVKNSVTLYEADLGGDYGRGFGITTGRSYKAIVVCVYAANAGSVCSTSVYCNGGVSLVSDSDTRRDGEAHAGCAIGIWRDVPAGVSVGGSEYDNGHAWIFGLN